MTPTLAEHCKLQKLNRKERLALFLSVCRRVQDLHSRFSTADISGITVTENGDLGIPATKGETAVQDLADLGGLLLTLGGPKAVAQRAQNRQFLSADALAAAVERSLQPGLLRRYALPALAVILLLSAAGAAAFYSAQQARLANRRYDEIRTLAREIVSGVGADLGSSPASLRAREGMARAADKYLQRLSQQGEADPALERDLAAAYQKIGELERSDAGGQLRDTAASYERADAIYGKLEREDPRVAASREDLHLSLAELYRAHLEPKRAVDHMKLAIRATENAIRTAGSNDQKAKMFERLERHRGLLAFDEGRYDQAIRAFNKYIEAGAVYSPFQARNRLLVAQAMMQAGRMGEAEQLLWETQTIVDAARKKRRTDSAYQMDRLRLHQAWIDLCAATNRPWPVLERVTAMQKELRSVPAPARNAEWHWLQCRMKIAETRAQLETKPWIAQPTAERARGFAAELYGKDADSPLYRWFNVQGAMLGAVSRAERLKWEDVEEEADAALAAMQALAATQPENAFLKQALARTWRDQARWLLLAKRKEESDAAQAESDASR